MSKQITRVAVAGATGNLGPSIVQELLSAGFTVTVLTRGGSKPTSLPSGVTAKEVDYSQPASLVAALQGQDAVVSNLGHTALGVQTALIDAAVEAGVTRFLPSEFGCDTTNEVAAKLPIFADKVKTQKYLAQLAKAGKISYTLVLTGGFLDWALQVGFMVNVKGGVTTLYDGGDFKFSTTTLSAIGQAVASVLRHPDETRNRAVRVQSAAVTQNQLLAAARKAKPGLETPTEEKSTEEIERESYKVLRTGEGDVGQAMIGFLYRAVAGQGYGSLFERTDNELLGVKGLSESEVGELVEASV